MLIARERCRFLMSLAVLVIAGCGGESRVPTYPVEGKLFVDDKPRGAAAISFKSTSKEVPSAYGVSKEDGSFSLKTYIDDDGVAEGSFNVEILPDPMSPTIAPPVEPHSLTIKKPDSGKLQLELKLKSSAKKDPAFMPPAI